MTPRGQRASIDGVPTPAPSAPAPAPPAPVLARRSAGRVVGGVAGGLADHLGVDVGRVRVALVVLAALSGAGVLAYGLLWVFTRPGGDTTPAPPAERRRAAGLAVLGAVLAVASSLLVSGQAADALGPLLVVAAGAALVWREVDGGRRWRGSSVLTWARVAGGATLVVVGLGVVVLAQVDLGAVRTAVLAVLATLLGVALLVLPFGLRLVRDLAEERRELVRTQERDAIASHLHDSVLQTLALIQRQADRPAEVARLARSQERALRTWLFDPGGEAAAGSLAGAVAVLAGQVEDDHHVVVQPVVVGDAPVDEAGAALLGAAREALVNAAKHAGVPTVDLYCEVEEDVVAVFVRDRGVGFDPAAVPADRHGIASSITERVRRHGGTAEVLSSPGAGTEVRLRVPVPR